MTDNFYKSKKWIRKRLSILRRDEYKCQECKKYGRIREAKIVHHIKEIDIHPELALIDDNLLSLCRECHNKAHPEKGTKSLRYQRMR